jgi:hypothetical protein
LAKIAGNEKIRVANTNVENLEQDEHLHPPSNYREPAELRADPYFKISIRSFASSMPPACARDGDRGLS